VSSSDILGACDHLLLETTTLLYNNLNPLPLIEEVSSQLISGWQRCSSATKIHLTLPQAMEYIPFYNLYSLSHCIIAKVV